MRIGIIGAGGLGTALAARAAEAGHEVMIGDATAEGCRTGTTAEAAAFGEVVVVAAPIDVLPADDLQGKVVIDATDDDPPTRGTTVARALPAARVVRAFTALRPEDLERSGEHAERRTLPVVGSDPAAVATVSALAGALGFDPQDAGAPRAASRMPAPFSPERLADRAEINHLIVRYCRGVDRSDYDAIRETYHPDATDDHGAYVGDREGLIDYIRDRHVGIPFSMHAIQNQLIEFTDLDTAVAETYVTTFQTYPPGSEESLAVLSGGVVTDASKTAHFLLGGRYVDVITRRDGVWRFQDRRAVYDAGVLLEGVPTVMGASWTTGRRDTSDPSYAVLP
jgi:predicted dinucleotide-binding enzyme